MKWTSLNILLNTEQNSKLIPKYRQNSFTYFLSTIWGKIVYYKENCIFTVSILFCCIILFNFSFHQNLKSKAFFFVNLTFIYLWFIIENPFIYFRILRSKILIYKVFSHSWIIAKYLVAGYFKSYINWNYQQKQW